MGFRSTIQDAQVRSAAPKTSGSTNEFDRMRVSLAFWQADKSEWLAQKLDVLTHGGKALTPTAAEQIGAAFLTFLQSAPTDLELQSGMKALEDTIHGLDSALSTNLLREGALEQLNRRLNVDGLDI